MLSAPCALLWLVAANLLAMLPSRDHHWRAAYGLMASGLPLVVWLWLDHGAPWALAFLLAAASVLRWPLFAALRWLKGLL